MALVSLRQILDHAAEHHYGVPAFNVSNMEQIKAVLDASRKTDSNAIIQFSSSARKYAGDIMIQAMIEGALKMYPDVHFALHQDHGGSEAICMSALYNGFTSVMMDGSLEADGKTPASYEYNARVTGHVASLAHMVGASVEGEIGVIGSLETGEGEKEDGHGFEGKLDKDMLLTKPDDAVAFSNDTKVDALAIAIGTSHGAYKFTKKPDGQILSIDTIKEIHKRLPNTHLVMHGSSSVPQELQDEINQFGGAIPQTFGVPMEEIQEGIKHGVRKVNVDTDLRMAMTGAVRKLFGTDPANFDVRKYIGLGQAAIEKVCAERYEQFGCAGHGSKLKPITMADMAKRYKDGTI